MLIHLYQEPTSCAGGQGAETSVGGVCGRFLKEERPLLPLRVSDIFTFTVRISRSPQWSRERPTLSHGVDPTVKGTRPHTRTDVRKRTQVPAPQEQIEMVHSDAPGADPGKQAGGKKPGQGASGCLSLLARLGRSPLSSRSPAVCPVG